MTIAALIAVYPLRQEHLSPAIDAVIATLAARGSPNHADPRAQLVDPVAPE